MVQQQQQQVFEQLCAQFSTYHMVISLYSLQLGSFLSESVFRNRKIWKIEQLREKNVTNLGGKTSSIRMTLIYTYLQYLLFIWVLSPVFLFIVHFSILFCLFRASSSVQGVSFEQVISINLQLSWSRCCVLLFIRSLFYSYVKCIFCFF